MMLGQLLAYDDDGNVIASLDVLVRRDDAGNVIGLVDFAATEEAGVAMDPAVWHVDGAAGSKAWPEWVDRPQRFRVEKEGPPGRRRLAALVDRETGRRRDRAAIEERIAERIRDANERGEPADLRDLVGGPERPLRT